MWLSRDPIAENGGINLYAYVGNDPINQIDPLGLWNVWNPLTYGIPSLPGENPWSPTDSSAHWDATVEGLSIGAAATADGIIPFADPFKNSGAYSDCDSGVKTSRFLGEFSRSAALTATGGIVASRLLAASPSAPAFSSLTLGEQSLISNNIGGAILSNSGIAGKSVGAGLTTGQVTSHALTAKSAADMFNNIYDTNNSNTGDGCK
jgi:hypothetical protein